MQTMQSNLEIKNSLIYFTAKSFYTFRVSQHPTSGVLKTVTAASGTGHTVKYKPCISQYDVFHSMTWSGGCGYSF